MSESSMKGASGKVDGEARAEVDKCPNCGRETGSDGETGCVLGALMQVLRDRGEHDDSDLREIQKQCDVDALWGDITPIINRLGERGYSD